MPGFPLCAFFSFQRFFTDFFALLEGGLQDRRGLVTVDLFDIKPGLWPFLSDSGVSCLNEVVQM